MPVRPSPLLLTTVGAALGAGLVGVIALGLMNGSDPVNMAILSWVTVTYSVSGLVAWRCRPGALHVSSPYAGAGIARAVSTRPVARSRPKAPRRHVVAASICVSLAE